MKTHFSIKIHELRHTKKHTIEVLAKNLDLTPEQLLMLETGESEPSAETLLKFAKYYNISTDELWGYPDLVTPLFQELKTYTSKKERELASEDLNMIISIARKIIINTNEITVLSEAYRALEYAYKMKGEVLKAKAIAEHRPFNVC